MKKVNKVTRKMKIRNTRRNRGVSKSVNKFNPVTKSYVCSICGKTDYGYGNNPFPVTETGRCCDDCNSLVVIPTRYRKMLEGIMGNGNN